MGIMIHSTDGSEMETYGYSYQLRAELQGGGTDDDGGMFDAETPQEARDQYEQMARSGKYRRLMVYVWQTGEIIGELSI